MASLRGARKISSYLVRAKLYRLEKRVGSFRCGGRRCKICLNVTETSTCTNQTYKMNHEFNCNESSFIYLLTVRSVVTSMLGKQLISFAVDRIIIKVLTKRI